MWLAGGGYRKPGTLAGGSFSVNTGIHLLGVILAILRPFSAKKKCAGVPEAVWGWFEVVSSGHGACAPSAHFFVLKIAQNISK